MNPARHVHRRALGVALVACWTLLAVAGCEQLTARRHIQKGNELFNDGKFEEAAAEFEAGLAKRPDLDIGQYNLGLTYYKLFRAGDTTDENKAVAQKSTEHFGHWLDSHPDDVQTRDMVTRIWVDSEQFEKALAYWQSEHDKEPKNRDVIERLAGINFKAGNFEEAVKWYNTEADAVSDPAAKISSYISIGRLSYARMSSTDPKKVLDAEGRIHVSDFGIAALQHAAALDAKNVEAQGMLGAMYSFRALAHGASWAAAIDRAAALHHQTKTRVLVEEAKKAQQQAAPAPAGGTPPAGSEKSGG